MADKFQLYLPLLHILILLNTTIQKKPNFSSLFFTFLLNSKSPLLPFSLSAYFYLVSVSISLCTQTDRSPPQCFVPLALPGEVSSPHHLGITLLPNSHSSSLCLLLLLTTSYCSDFKSQRVIEDLIGAKAEVTVWCHRWV